LDLGQRRAGNAVGQLHQGLLGASMHKTTWPGRAQLLKEASNGLIGDGSASLDGWPDEAA